MSGEQQKIDAIVQRLPAALDAGLTATVNWIKEYAEAETGKADCRRPQVYEAFKEAGFVPNEHTGDQFVKGSKYSMGRFIVGQLMDFLEQDSGLPNAASFFPDRYNAMPGEPVAPADTRPRGPIAVMRPIKLKFAP